MKNATSIFSTVRATDHLGFWADQILQPKKVADFLNLQKSDVARISDVAPSSVRFDPKIPHEVFERLEEIANICALVAEFFNGDVAKTALWFKTNNPQFGNLSPRDMIRYGRYKKLHQYVLAALQNNSTQASNPSVRAPHAASTAAAT